MRRFFVIGVLVALLSVGVVGTASAAPVQVHHGRATAFSPRPGTVLTQPNCFQPPKGADLATLTVMSSAQLRSYGLMPRSWFPPTAAGTANWTKALAHAQRRACTMTAAPADVHFGAVKSARPANEHGPYKQQVPGAWTGYEQDANVGLYGLWIENTGTWYVTPAQGIQEEETLVGDWVGMGGYANNNLVQTGISITQDGTGRIYYQAWVENTANTAPPYGYQPWYLSNVNYPVRANDEMQAWVDGDNIMTLEDYTQNWYYSIGYGPGYNAHNAECIREIVNSYNIQTNQLNWYGCEAQAADGTWVQMGCNPCDAYTLFQADRGTTILEDPDQPSSGNFDDNFGSR